MSKKIYIPLILLLVLFASFSGASNAMAWSGCGGSYYVQWGDTLSGIAVKCGTTVADIQLANPGLGYWAYAGQVLHMPGTSWNNGNGSTYVVARGDTLRSIANNYGTTVSALASLNGIYNYNLIYVGQVLTISGSTYTPPPYTPPSNPGGTYVVQRGDTLRIIAARYGVSVADIWFANPNIANPSLIYVGQVIYLPGAVSAPSSYYTVQRGDTLRIIANLYGTSVYNLQLLNPQIWNPNLIYVGMVIQVQ